MSKAWAVGCDVPHGQFSQLHVHVRDQPPVWEQPIQQFRFVENVPPKLTAILPSQGPSTGGTKVYLFGDIHEPNRLVCRFGSAGTAPIHCTSEEEMVHPFAHDWLQLTSRWAHPVKIPHD